MSVAVRQSRGSAAITALIVMSILAIVGTAAAVLSSTEGAIAAGYRDGIAAQYLAEAGALWAITQLKKENSVVITNIQTTGEYKAVSSTKNSGATTGTYQISIANPDFPQDKGSRTITSVGVISVSKAARTVGLLTIGGSGTGGIYKNAVYSGSDIVVEGQGVITGNAAAAGSIVGSHAISGSSSPHSQEPMPSFGIIDYMNKPQINPIISNLETVTLRAAKYYTDKDFTVSGTIDNVTSEPVIIYAKGNVTINNGAKCRGPITIVTRGTVTVNQHESTSLTLVALDSHDSQVTAGAVLNGRIIAKGRVIVNGMVSHGFQVVAWKNHR